ncbi:hypothetical protein OHA40_33845 [Nocardia sp. NBC_00508]|uniref:hypothetical protein n=1 Tax=Nocardia sp. NBC_00508 TaxID=2975992 RepID=UPI002E80BCBA|nr:hypothetical protein [Nocardia sp. NBC_00508]WUD66469.1 hypothetical protein OHA40_33845 [Nocardia sp. NBC_00508]
MNDGNPAPIGLSRRSVLRRAVWSGAAVTAGLSLGDVPARAEVTAFPWCDRCQSLWFNGGGDNGHCPVTHLWDHSHYQHGSVYKLRKSTEPGNGQIGWHWCRYCKAAFYYGDGEVGRGVCPNNPTPLALHSEGDREIAPGGASWVSFRMETDVANNGPGAQAGWRSCFKCNVMFFADNGLAATHCPAGGEHDPTRSFHYLMRD